MDLPAKIRILRSAELTDEAKTIYESVFNMLRTRWLNALAKGEVLGINEKLVMFTQLRHAASFGKLYTAKDLAEELIEEGHKVVFFTAFIDSAEALAYNLSSVGKTGLITGNVSFAHRQQAIDEFQNGSLNFLVSTIGAGGLGITLTAANHVIMVDRPWTPGDAFQAEDRAHRIGQKDTVTSIWLQCNSSDAHVDNVLLFKQRNISKVLTGDSFQEELTFDIRQEIDAIFSDLFVKAK
jgi:SNF2 family DNA or RNA helicase